MASKTKGSKGCLVVVVLCGISILLACIDSAIETRGIALIPIAIIVALILKYGKYEQKKTREKTAYETVAKNRA